MSINDLLASESLIPTMMVIFILILIIALPTGIVMGKKANKEIFGEQSVEEAVNSAISKKATLVSKSVTPHPLSPTVSVYKMVFEYEDELSAKNRLVFAIRDVNVFDALIEGDVGELVYSDNTFVDFIVE